jgi:ferredoxin-NADP reductase
VPPTVALVTDQLPDRTLRVLELRDPAVGVRELVLGPADGTALPAWSPGAHVDLVLGPGLVRSYSLCGVPGAPRWRLAVLREPTGRGGSAHVHDRLRVGDEVSVRGPRNHFPLVAADALLFVAGGIGITPLLPMVAAAASAGADWRLLYGGRRRAGMAYLDELGVHGERVAVVPQDECGLLDLDAALRDAPTGVTVYCCGPEPLLRAVEQRVPPHRLHVERFAAVPAQGLATAFDVRLARSGRILRVGADRSLLDVLEAAGVDVLPSCREGTCGSCETAVLAGRPDHRDVVLDADERASGASMMVCVSRSLDPELELDL